MTLEELGKIVTRIDGFQSIGPRSGEIIAGTIAWEIAGWLEQKARSAQYEGAWSAGEYVKCLAGELRGIIGQA